VPSVPSAGVIEATSLSVLEAMAIGAPVIGSAVGGIAEIMEGKDLGFLVPPAGVEEFSAAIRALVSMDAAARDAVIRNARNRVQAKFGVDRWVASITSVYNEALDSLDQTRAADKKASAQPYARTPSSSVKIRAEVKGN